MNDFDGQDLNESRFLLEEINVDEDPTHEQILERAQELDIDDLTLAKESLTKELDPEWKPYCNRFGDIYYINLIERKAYIDHPIDMLYKKLDCANNHLPLPRYASYRIDEISQSLALVEAEIRNFNSHGSTLRVVYEEPSEEDVCSNPRSPSNYLNPSHPGSSNRKDAPIEYQTHEQQLSPQETAEMLAFKSMLTAHYETELAEHMKQITLVLNRLQKQQADKQQRILEVKMGEMGDKWAKQIKTKNQSDYDRQANKAQSDQHSKLDTYYQDMGHFNSLFDDLMARQANVDALKREIQVMQRTALCTQVQANRQMVLSRNLSKLKGKLLAEFDHKSGLILGGSDILQASLQQDLRKLLSGRSSTKGELKKRSRIFQSPSIMSASNMKSGKQSENDSWEWQLRKEIDGHKSWGEDVVEVMGIHSVSPSLQPRNGLNMRLRMRII